MLTVLFSPLGKLHACYCSWSLLLPKHDADPVESPDAFSDMKAYSIHQCTHAALLDGTDCLPEACPQALLLAKSLLMTSNLISENLC